MEQAYQFAQLNGTKIHYEVRGEGTAVTFIHSSSTDISQWDAQMDDFAASHRTLRYDASSGKLEDLHALLHYLDIEETTVIGSGSGSKIALDFALAHPAMVSALILVGADIEINEQTMTRLATIQHPVRILTGENDRPEIHTAAELLEEHLPFAEERTIMPETTQFMNMERPSRFNSIVLRFLDKLVWRSTIYAILPHQTEAKVWLVQTEHGYALPHITMTGGRWETTEAQVERPLRQQFGDVRVLYQAHFQEDENTKTTESVFVLDNVQANVQNGRWVDLQTLPTLALTQPNHKRLIENSLQEWVTGNVSARRPAWARRGWYAQVTAWIAESLQQAGHPLTTPVELVRSWGLSYVMKAQTEDGVFFFKTVAQLPLFVHEAMTTKALARLFPTHILTPVAMDTERDWMLLPALEQMVGWNAPMSQRAEFLRQFAQLQVTAVSHLDTLFAASLHDRRLAWTSAQIEPLLTNEYCQRSLTPEEVTELINLIPSLQNLCQELGNASIPQTLVHGDLHGGNVGMQNGSFVFFDWTDACISHPFFDMLDIFYEEDTAVQTELRDAYLEEWIEFAPMPQLLQIWQMAEIGAAIHHAISYWQILVNLERHSWSDMGEMVPFWLRKILTLSKQLQGEKLT